jgi:hypothetical protein
MPNRFYPSGPVLSTEKFIELGMPGPDSRNSNLIRWMNLLHGISRATTEEDSAIWRILRSGVWFPVERVKPAVPGHRGAPRHRLSSIAFDTALTCRTGLCYSLANTALVGG